jgi:hypothetical protein
MIGPNRFQRRLAAKELRAGKLLRQIVPPGQIPPHERIRHADVAGTIHKGQNCQTARLGDVLGDMARYELTKEK